VSDFDPAVQEGPSGKLSEPFLDRFYAVKKKYGVATWRIARWAGWADSYLGNATRRDPADGKGLGVHVRAPYANRLKAVIETLEAAPAGSDLDALFAPPATTEPVSEPTAPVQTPTAPTDLAQAIAILRQHGIRGIWLS
jgi:hypothetical protein